MSTICVDLSIASGPDPDEARTVKTAFWATDCVAGAAAQPAKPSKLIVQQQTRRRSSCIVCDRLPRVPIRKNEMSPMAKPQKDAFSERNRAPQKSDCYCLRHQE